MKKFVTLVLAVLMVATLVVSASAAVEKDQSIVTLNLNTGAKYDSKITTILARVNGLTKLEETVQYLANRGTKNTDYNYFWVYEVELKDGNYVITAAHTDTGRTGSGTDSDPYVYNGESNKANIVIPENGFLLCWNITDFDSAGSEQEAIYKKLQTVKVGDIVVLDGVDLTELKALEPGDNSIEGVGTATIWSAKEVAEESKDESAPEADTSKDTSADASKPADTSKDDKNPPTGDATMVFALIALVTVAGAVVVARKRVR